MARTWLPIRVDLIEGHGEQYWPRPGRIFAAVRSHTFKQLANAIDDAFARWDRSHLQEFTLADGRRLRDPGLPRARPMLPRAPAQNTQIRTNRRAIPSGPNRHPSRRIFALVSGISRYGR